MEKEKLLEALKNPGMYHLFVRHDDWCPLLLNDGECRCSPDLEFITQTDQNVDAVAAKIVDGAVSVEQLRRAQRS